MSSDDIVVTSALSSLNKWRGHRRNRGILEYAIKKYKSHRRLSPNLKLETIVDEFTEHREKKMSFKRSK